MPRALVILSDGVEELEAVAPIDLLRRAGVETLILSTDGPVLTGRNGIGLASDRPLAERPDTASCELLVLPGGPSAQRLKNHPEVLALVREFVAAGKLVGAICAAPLILHNAGVLEGRAFTSHHSTAADLPRRDPAARAVRDGQIITSAGAGTSVEFGLALVEALCGAEKSREIAAAISWTR